MTAVFEGWGGRIAAALAGIFLIAACSIVVFDGYAREETATFAVAYDWLNNVGISAVQQGDLSDDDLRQLSRTSAAFGVALDRFWDLAQSYEAGQTSAFAIAGAVTSTVETFEAFEDLLTETDVLGVDGAGAVFFSINAAVEFEILQQEILLAAQENRQIPLSSVETRIEIAENSAEWLQSLIDAALGETQTGSR